MTNQRSWDGKAVALTKGGLGSIFTTKVAELHLTEEALRKLSWALASYAAVRKYQGRKELLLPEVQELLDAINYVLVGDPESTAKHRALQVGKGMTPDGGYRAPQPDHSPGACRILGEKWCGAERCE